MTRNYLFWSKILLIDLYCTIMVQADYCEFGTCNEDQYCCGENKCCKKTVEVWYFWAGILLIVIAVFLTICLFIRRKVRQKDRQLRQKDGHHYRLLKDDIKIPVL